MESIISALCTPNESLIRNTNFIFIPIEAIISILLFTTILNVKSNVKTKVSYIIISTLLVGIINFAFPQLKILITVINFLCIYLFFKLTLIKTFVACLLQLIITIVLENIFAICTTAFFGIPYATLQYIPIGSYSVRLLTYLIEFVLYIFIKKINFNITVLDNITPKSKKIILANLFIGTLFMVSQITMFNYYAVSIPSYMSVFNIIIIISYFFISIYGLTKTSNLESANQRIESLELYNKTLNLLHDNIRAFKHDFNNIIQAIGRICCNK